MVIDLKALSAVLGLLVTLGGILAALYSLFYRFQRLEKQASHRKDDDEIIIEALLAVLDGLKEQGCNGTVTAAREKLRKHLIESR